MQSSVRSVPRDSITSLIKLIDISTSFSADLIIYTVVEKGALGCAVVRSIFVLVSNLMTKIDFKTAPSGHAF